MANSQWTEIADKNVLHEWRCDECGEEVAVNPDFYEPSGEPDCAEHGIMEYVRTTVKIESDEHYREVFGEIIAMMEEDLLVSFPTALEAAINMYHMDETEEAAFRKWIRDQFPSENFRKMLDLHQI